MIKQRKTNNIKYDYLLAILIVLNFIKMLKSLFIILSKFYVRIERYLRL